MDVEAKAAEADDNARRAALLEAHRGQMKARDAADRDRAVDSYARQFDPNYQGNNAQRFDSYGFIDGLIGRKRAARLAVEAAHAKSLTVGGRLAITYTHLVDLPGTEQPAINWAMQYTPPGSFATFESAPADAPAANPFAAQPQPTAPAAPVAAPAVPAQAVQPAWTPQAAPVQQAAPALPPACCSACTTAAASRWI